MAHHRVPSKPCFFGSRSPCLLHMFYKPRERTRYPRVFREASRAMNISPPTARTRLGCEQRLSPDATLALPRRRLHDGMNSVSASVPRRLEPIPSVQLVLLACGPRRGICRPRWSQPPQYGTEYQPPPLCPSMCATAGTPALRISITLCP